MPPELQLKKGMGTVRSNVQTLMANPVRSKARKKAILTIAKRRNIPRADAAFVNAQAIAKSLARKK